MVLGQDHPMAPIWQRLQHRLFDTHCHPLDYANPQEILGTCQELRIRIHAMSTLPEQYRKLRELTATHLTVRPSLGLYPLLLKGDGLELSQLLDLLPGTLLVGEVGLDFSENSPPHDLQNEALKTILEKSDELGGRIVSLHSRRAGKEVIELARATRFGSMILHWYSGPLDAISQLPGHIYFSVNTAMLRSRRGKALLEACPRQRILLESDGPFVLTGGRPVCPWELKSIVEALASRWQMNPEGVLDLLHENLGRVDDSVSSALLRAPRSQ